ncbi:MULTISPECIES: tRNA (guanosine(37)-N1)-methyltransferase TrmD [unclassified Cryobacterium]|uniref:tRNA (guanosine(37)-N1)-methyltransferase TrmD n=1 Tax=unclassified Cryobacterium TaxID=2649013 RepID=UPI000CE3CFF5|nr:MULTISPECIES: tRNA (guanosine(37)-N1)-methyltransferase TrmD [unclassified Cryobacterium]TFD60041.1 tRNA (guanosine(37)-N1)-methyltransferase TrmD [Cryobacterium sp. Hh38]
MRIDIVTIFPEFFDVLDLSLLGKARQSGLIELGVHNLRDHTHDRHHSVDDTPYGGGAGMVMKAEPWGAALDAILGAAPEAVATEAVATDAAAVATEAAATETPTAVNAADDGPILIFPSPAGAQFTQAMARELSLEQHLIFGCGRYEGIDQRVVDHYEARGRVRLVSLGDYVLNGGEVAVMAMIEAIGRLIPGVVGNPESLVEESHEDGLLEYPSYTKPSSWRGLDVPPVLLSGNHGAISTWRRQQQIERTERVRPDLMSPDLLPPANAKQSPSRRR